MKFDFYPLGKNFIISDVLQQQAQAAAAACRASLSHMPPFYF
jgi:hypothetical protein